MIRFSLVVLALLLAGCSEATEAVGSNSQAKQAFPAAPQWSLPDQAGQPVEFGGAPERPTILLFWASWCPYCKQLMPHLQSIKDQYGDDIEILALNVFEDDDPVAFMAEYGYQFRLLPNADSVASAYGVKGTPGLFLVDESGRVRYNLYEVDVAKSIPEDIKRWQKAARLAPLWAAELRKAITSL